MIVWVVTDDTQIALSDDERGFFADAFNGYDLDLSSSKSRHPISKDSNKSDHISLNPIGLRLEGCIGSSAFRKGEDLFAGSQDRTAAACELLIEMWRSKQCINVIQKGKTFENMVLTNAPIRCTAEGSLTFTLEFEEFEFYDISEVFEATIGRKVDLGEVATTPGQPANIGDVNNGVLFASTLDQVSECALGCAVASNTTCLDACYGSADF